MHTVNINDNIKYHVFTPLTPCFCNWTSINVSIINRVTLKLKSNDYRPGNEELMM